MLLGQHVDGQKTASFAQVGQIYFGGVGQFCIGGNTLRDGRIADPEWPLRVADDYLRGIGLTLLAWAWLRSAQAALARTGDPWHDDKLRTARFGVQWLLPEAHWRWARVMASDAVLPEAS